MHFIQLNLCLVEVLLENGLYVVYANRTYKHDL